MASSAVEGIVSRFQQYLGINTVHPNPNYYDAADFIIREAQLINLEAQLFECFPMVLLKWTGSDDSLPAILLKSLNIAVVLDKGLPSPTKSYRMFYGERMTWKLEIKAVGQPGHGAKLYDNSAMENLTKSIVCIMRYRDSQFDLLKAGGFKAEGHVVSVNMVYLKAGTPNHDDGFVMNPQPSEAVAGFDIRLPPFADPDALMSRLLEEWAPSARKMSFKLSRTDQGIARNQLVTATDDTNTWWGLLETAVKQAGGMTSMPEILPESTGSWYFRKAGLPTIGFSPISNTPSLRHDHNEYLSLSEYLKGIDMYVSILMAYTSYAL